MTRPAVIILMVLLFSWAATGSRYLIYPLIGGFNSRLLNAEKMANLLTARGHDVYFLVSEFHEACDKCDLSPAVKTLLYQEPGADVMRFLDKEFVRFFIEEDSKGLREVLIKQQVTYCRNILENKDLMMKLIQLNFDAVMYDNANLCTTVLIDYINRPAVLYSNVGWSGIPGIDFPINPTYMPSPFSDNTDIMDFRQRVTNTFFTFASYIFFNKLYLSEMTKLKTEFHLNESYSVTDAYLRAILVFINSDFVYETPLPLFPHIVTIGGIDLKKAKPLPNDLQRIYDKSGEHGVILFSFGTVMNMIGQKRVNFMMNTFRSLKQHVVWRYVEEVVKWDDVPANVHLQEWLPQNDILANNKTRLFITHAGSSSMREAIYHGVPVVAIPLFADQFNNAAKLVIRAGMGVYLDFKTLTDITLKNAIDEVLKNDTYSKNAQIASSRMRRPLVNSKDKFVYYMERAAEPGALDHLYPHGAIKLSWYQYFGVDIMSLITTALAAVCAFVYLTVKCLLWLCCRKTKIKKE